MTCPHTNRTLLGTKTVNDNLIRRTERCDDCGKQIETELLTGDVLYKCNGNCIDCHEAKEDEPCDKG